MRRPTRKLFLTAAVLALLLLCLTASGCAKADKVEYVTTRAGLAKALADRRETVYVDSIAFDEADAAVGIDRSVRIVGREDGSSRFDRARFVIRGPEVESETITVSFENIAFDGGYEMPSGDPSKAADFASFHGDRADLREIYAEGFLDLTLKNCSVSRYCAPYGAAMYLRYSDGNADIGTRARLTVDGCTFTGNVCEKGVIWVNGKNTACTVTNSKVSENAIHSGAVVLGGVAGTVDNVEIFRNMRKNYAKNTFPDAGGGLVVAKSELLLRNSVVSYNETSRGGGIAVAGSSVTMESCVISFNTADEFGGGMLIESSESTPVYVTNCSFLNNNAAEEGAVYVWPADQINLGVPTGITEFSFCTFENNRSRTGGTYVFHPVAGEAGSAAGGRDGTVDFIACRFWNETVPETLVSGENWNLVNEPSDKVLEVPVETVRTVANGYYADAKKTRSAGVNTLTSSHPWIGKPSSSAAKQSAARLIWLVPLLCVILAAVYLFFVRTKRKTGELAGGTRTPARSSSLSLAEIDEACRKLTEDRTLTTRETDVLRAYLEGKTRAEIAKELFITESTAKNHISSIFSKLAVRNRSELVAKLTGKTE
jgi:DNA-binding CsgD family transcriptional regulator